MAFGLWNGIWMMRLGVGRGLTITSGQQRASRPCPNQGNRFYTSSTRRRKMNYQYSTQLTGLCADFCKSTSVACYETKYRIEEGLAARAIQARWPPTEKATLGEGS